MNTKSKNKIVVVLDKKHAILRLLTILYFLQEQSMSFPVYITQLFSLITM